MQRHIYYLYSLALNYLCYVGNEGLIIHQLLEEFEL